MLFSDLCDRYVNEFASCKKTAAGDRWMIAKFLLPRFGAEQVAAIRFGSVFKFHAELNSTPYLANRLLSLLSRLLTLAGQLDVPNLPANPCRFVKRFPEKKRRRYATIPEMIAVVDAIEARFEKYPLECALLLLELYTGARPSELKTALWSMIDGERLEHDDTKTGQRTIHLSPEALTVLARLPRPRQFIIGPDINARYIWASILKETGITNLRMYDLRHSFASFGLELGYTLPQIGELLGHSSPTTTARYAHLAKERGKTLADGIGAHIRGAIDAQVQP